MPGRSRENLLLNSDFRDILSAFCEEKVDFMLVGAYAVAVHGLPRATGDIDLWISRDPVNAERVWRALSRFGAAVPDLSVNDFSKPETVIQLGLSPLRIDILTSLTGLDFDEAQKEMLLVKIEGLEIPVISRSHLIKNKRALGRPQDQADVSRLEAE
jgi:hypothetical protein